MRQSTEDFTKRKAIKLPDGGKEPIERIMAAYGYTSRLALCKHLDVSQSTLANRVSRGNFPADWVLICSMETGATLEWLIYGKGPVYSDNTSPQNLILERKTISNGNFTDTDWVSIDASIMPTDLTSPFLVTFEKQLYVVDSFNGKINDGLWLIEFDGFVSVRELYRIPSERVRVENGKASFECQTDEIKILGQIISKTEFFDR
ncbi:phage repressor protein CI [Plesiomonas sp. ZOR0011]|uniref:phage repressor protein CI n=1 Tax=Plesiomonas sp. ZOR0011 TaxID=1339230 RepID=UPI000647555F|nr:phage repressor protein CI [Plesiomonas sp. ZOR0011]